ncbi:extracellular solute-binding protein [Nonomuraea lactucae]|uniref:extracellular solute-binding protein n=1 Tax=Nonomuraea lactucae TaxID=2249762 RepID=UPI0013B3D6A1|nr:extracellular solute-binding protein [Nonomuraea lactucae]
MKRITTTIAAVLALSSLALSGCASGGAGAGGDPGTITFMAAAYSDKTQTYWKDLIDKFQKANPGKKVELSVVSWNDYDQRVTTLLANKQQPDVLNYNTWSAYAAADLLHPIDKIVSPVVRSDFIKTFVDNDSLNGTTYALPFIASARALYYSKKIFAKAGVAGPPKTWGEFVTAAKKIKEAGFTGYAMPLGAEEAQSEFALWAYNGGGDWQKAGAWDINSAANVATAQFLNKLVNSDKVTQANPWATNRTDGAWQPFADGRVGMVFGFPGTFGQMLDKAGMTTEDYGVAPLPTKDDGIPSTTLGVQDVLVGFKGDTDKTATIRAFLDFFYQKDNYTKFLTQEGFLPTTQSASDGLADDPVLGAYIALLPHAKFAPTGHPAWTAVAGSVKQRIGEIAKPDADVKAVLDALQADAEKAK